MLLLRVELPNVPGSLGRLASAIGAAGGDIEAIEIVEKRYDGTAVDDDASVNGSIDVVGMPRRAQRSQWDALPTAEDLWSDGDHPTVADLELGEAI